MKISKEKIKYFFRLPDKKFMLKNTKKYSLILIIAIFFSFFFVKNLQTSLPLGIYVKNFSKNYKKDDIIIFDIDKKYNKFFNKKGILKHVMKRITADSNDEIKIIKNEIYVNNQNYGEIQELNLPIPDLKIKKGCFFVLSKQLGSFDSRYFGQVCEKQIKYKAIPFIVF